MPINNMIVPIGILLLSSETSAAFGGERDTFHRQRKIVPGRNVVVLSAAGSDEAYGSLLDKLSVADIPNAATAAPRVAGKAATALPKLDTSLPGNLVPEAPPPGPETVPSVSEIASSISSSASKAAENANIDTLGETKARLAEAVSKAAENANANIDTLGETKARLAEAASQSSKFMEIAKSKLEATPGQPGAGETLSAFLKDKAPELLQSVQAAQLPSDELVKKITATASEVKLPALDVAEGIKLQTEQAFTQNVQAIEQGTEQVTKNLQSIEQGAGDLVNSIKSIDWHTMGPFAAMGDFLSGGAGEIRNVQDLYDALEVEVYGAWYVSFLLFFLAINQRYVGEYEGEAKAIRKMNVTKSESLAGQIEGSSPAVVNGEESPAIKILKEENTLLREQIGLLTTESKELRDQLKEAMKLIGQVAGVEAVVDISIPYDAAAKLAYESSDKSMSYDDFKIKYEADAVADVIAKQPKPEVVAPPAKEAVIEVSIPYDAAAKLAYESSDKSMSYDDFKAKYEADAVSDVIAKQPKPEVIAPPAKEIVVTPPQQAVASKPKGKTAKKAVKKKVKKKKIIKKKVIKVVANGAANGAVNGAATPAPKKSAKKVKKVAEPEKAPSLSINGETPVVKRSASRKKGAAESDWSKLSMSTLKRKTVKDLTGYLANQGKSVTDENGKTLKKALLVEAIMA